MQMVFILPVVTSRTCGAAVRSYKLV